MVLWTCMDGVIFNSLSERLTFNLLGIPYFSRKQKFKLLFHGPKWPFRKLRRWVFSTRKFLKLPSSFWGVILDIQNPPNTWWGSVWKEPLKAEPGEMFWGSNTSSIGVWMSRVFQIFTKHPCVFVEGNTLPGTIKKSFLHWWFSIIFPVWWDMSLLEGNLFNASHCSQNRASNDPLFFVAGSFWMMRTPVSNMEIPMASPGLFLQTDSKKSQLNSWTHSRTFHSSFKRRHRKRLLNPRSMAWKVKPKLESRTPISWRFLWFCNWKDLEDSKLRRKKHTVSL